MTERSVVTMDICTRKQLMATNAATRISARGRAEGLKGIMGVRLFGLQKVLEIYSFISMDSREVRRSYQAIM